MTDKMTDKMKIYKAFERVQLTRTEQGIIECFCKRRTPQQTADLLKIEQENGSQSPLL